MALIKQVFSIILKMFNQICCRAASSPVYQRKSKICGCPSKWLQSASSSKVEFYTIFRMNIVDVFYCLPNFLEIKASSITFIPVKTFHTKCETSRKRRVFGHKRNNFNEDDSTIFSYFVKLSSAAFVSI